ncbi:MAG TPA: KH domain-containing protein [Candidatus Caenarcaniphilales bacterium]
MNSLNRDGPNYTELVRFLVQPFLESPDTLKVDCEVIPAKARVWIRLAFAASDKGRVFGRGGRTIQAIRTVVEAAAQGAGHSVYLDIYGSHEQPQKSEADKKVVPKRRIVSGVPQIEIQ